jgi:hypothetical protein
MPPFRSAAEAIASQTARLQGLKESLEPSDLEKVLKTPLSESRVGFVNGHHLLETEVRELGHFSYALNPLYNATTDGKQQFLIFGNSPNFLNYRSGSLAESLLRNSDRVIWAENNGLRVSTIIQVDNDLSEDLLRFIVTSRASAGLRVFVVGNEFNDPGAPWRYDLARLLRSLQVVKETLSQMGIRDGEVYTPALAYYEGDKHLETLLSYAARDGKTLPADGIAKNYYGPLAALVGQISATRAVMKRFGLQDLRLRITELGNPTDTLQQEFDDERLTYNYFPQAIALALSEGEVDSVDLFSLFDFGRDQYSLTYLEGTTLKPKASLLAARLAARVFSRVKDADYRVRAGRRPQAVGGLVRGRRP